MKDYNRSNTPLAKTLRKSMTPWEQKLCYMFLRSYPIRFQRQKPIGNFVVDFYCAKAGLALELDGGGHYTDEQMLKDTERTEKLAEMKVAVLRICNTDVDKNFDGVCEEIDRTVKRLRSERERGGR